MPNNVPASTFMRILIERLSAANKRRTQRAIER